MPSELGERLNQQKYPVTGDFGISGAVSDKVMAENAGARAGYPFSLYDHPHGGERCEGANFSAGHTMANLTEAANKALAQGTIPILFTDPGSEHYSAAQVAFINDVNARIKAYCAATPKAVLSIWRS